MVKAKQAYKAQLAEIEKFRGSYLPEEIAKQQAKAKADYDNARSQAFESISGRLDELETSINERHAELDLNNPAWQNALKMIEMGVTEAQTLHKINASFTYNQPALRALREVYKAKNIAYDGGLDKMIYDIAGSFAGLRDEASRSFLRDGSINSFAGKVARIARLEGFDFNNNPDPDGFEEALFQGAGLQQP